MKKLLFISFITVQLSACNMLDIFGLSGGNSDSSEDTSSTAPSVSTADSSSSTAAEETSFSSESLVTEEAQSTDTLSQSVDEGVTADPDIDDDGILNDRDNCPNYANKEQTDGDNDGLGDECDACSHDAKNDEDADNVCGDSDNCPTVANGTQADTYGVSTLGDACEVLGAPIIDGVSYNTSNYKITITGSNLSDTNGVMIKSGSNQIASLVIESKTATTVVAYVSDALSLAAGTLYDLIISNASAATSVSISLLPADGSVTTAKIADGAVTTVKVADGTITTAKILDSAVTAAKIADSGVTTAKINDGAITTAKIVDGAVTADKLDTNAVTSAKIGSNAVTSAKIADGTVGTADIEDGSIVNADISSSAAIAVSKLAAGTDGQILYMNGSAQSWTGEGGWMPSGETWTYASADDPTFTFTISGDKSSKYSAGMRVKLTQTTAKYFIITAVAYAAPNTTITVYGGTDYDLDNASISSPFYSGIKAPVGFPLDPLKWTVETKDTTLRTQSSPAQNTWYNQGSISIVIPIGIWNVSYHVVADVYDSDNVSEVSMRTTFSTANNSESDSDFTAWIYSYTTSTQGRQVIDTLYRTKTLNLNSKTTYYLNSKTSLSGMSHLRFDNDTSPAIIRAVCAYL